MTTWNMTTSTRPLDISLAHFRAWTCGDFDTAMTYIAPGIVCRTPAGEITGAQAYAEFMGPFAGGLHRAELLASFGDDHRAMIIYDTVTAAVDDAPGAELHTVSDGLITELKIIFDRLPFARARSGS